MLVQKYRMKLDNVPVDYNPVGSPITDDEGEIIGFISWYDGEYATVTCFGPHDMDADDMIEYKMKFLSAKISDKEMDNDTINAQNVKGSFMSQVVVSKVEGFSNGLL